MPYLHKIVYNPGSGLQILSIFVGHPRVPDPGIFRIKIVIVHIPRIFLAFGDSTGAKKIIALR